MALQTSTGDPPQWWQFPDSTTAGTWHQIDEGTWYTEAAPEQTVERLLSIAVGEVPELIPLALNKVVLPGDIMYVNKVVQRNPMSYDYWQDSATTPLPCTQSSSRRTSRPDVVIYSITYMYEIVRGVSPTTYRVVTSGELGRFPTLFQRLAESGQLGPEATASLVKTEFVGGKHVISYGDPER